jgi:hypothetical protein
LLCCSCFQLFAKERTGASGKHNNSSREREKIASFCSSTIGDTAGGREWRACVVFLFMAHCRCSEIIKLNPFLWLDEAFFFSFFLSMLAEELAVVVPPHSCDFLVVHLRADVFCGLLFTPPFPGRRASPNVRQSVHRPCVRSACMRQVWVDLSIPHQTESTALGLHFSTILPPLPFPNFLFLSLTSTTWLFMCTLTSDSGGCPHTNTHTHKLPPPSPPFFPS